MRMRLEPALREAVIPMLSAKEVVLSVEGRKSSYIRLSFTAN